MHARSRRHENRNRTGKTYVINNTEGNIYLSAKAFFSVRNSSFLFVVPSWAKAPPSGNSSPPVSSENSPRPERTEVFENRTVEPEDMSKDRNLPTVNKFGLPTESRVDRSEQSVEP